MSRAKLLLSAACVALIGTAGCGGASSTPAASRPSASTPAHRAARPAQAPSMSSRLLGHLPRPVRAPATTAVGASVLLMGGLTAADVSTSDVTTIDSHGTARPSGSLPTAVHDAAGATLNGRPYLFGGGEPSHAEIVAGSQNGHPVVGHLSQPASDVAAASLNGAVYIVGGYTGTSPLRTILRWTGGGSTTVAGTLPLPLRYAAVAAADGRLIIAGGTSGTAASSSVLRFDPASGQVREIARMRHPLTHAAAAEIGGMVYVIGGRGATEGTQTAQILAIDPASGRVTAAGRLPVALSDVGAATTPDGVVVAGGLTRVGTASDRIYLLRPGASRG